MASGRRVFRSSLIEYNWAKLNQWADSRSMGSLAQMPGTVQRLAACIFVGFGVSLGIGTWMPATALNQEPAGGVEFKPYVETIPGSSVKFEMLPIPAGTFLMGSPASEAGRGAD